MSGLLGLRKAQIYGKLASDCEVDSIFVGKHKLEINSPCTRQKILKKFITVVDARDDHSTVIQNGLIVWLTLTVVARVFVQTHWVFRTRIPHTLVDVCSMTQKHNQKSILKLKNNTKAKRNFETHSDRSVMIKIKNYLSKIMRDIWNHDWRCDWHI